MKTILSILLAVLAIGFADVGGSSAQLDKLLKDKKKDKGKSDSQGGRAAGGGQQQEGAKDSRLTQALTDLRKLFGDFDTVIKEGKWGNQNWESQLPRYVNKIELQIQMIEKNWPKEDTKPMWEGVDRRKAAIAARGNSAGGGGNSAASMLPYYKGIAEAVSRSPYDIVAEHMLPTVSGDQVQPSTMVQILQQIDYPSLAKRMASDKASQPKYFYALKNRLHKPARGQEAKDGKEIGVTSGDDEKINESINKLLLWKDKMEDGQRELARAVSICIAQGDGITYSTDVKLAYFEMAGLMARSFKAMFPDNPVFEDVEKEANSAFERAMTNFAHLFTSPFHKQNVNKVVLFKNPQTVGKENAADIVTEIVPGQPVYAMAYFRQTVKEIGATKIDRDLGYSVSCLPDAFFKLSTEDKGVSSSVHLYDVGGKDQPALKLSYIAVDLLPDPEKTTYKSHLQYLPTLHMVKWMLSLTPGTYDIVFGLDDKGYDDKFAATGNFRIQLDGKGKEVLKAYYEKLWVKKLSTVVFPDHYGSVDKQLEIPNRDELSKYGKLIKLSCAQTGVVMKPFPNQTQVDNYVGTGYGLFERTDGKYEIILLSFSRRPTEKNFRWTGLGAIPDDYTFSSNGYQIRPTILNFGYEIPKENIAKSGNWKQ